MRVLVAKTAGFCDGVKRAVRIALEAAARHGRVRADGPLIHNPQAVRLLEASGVESGGGMSEGDVPVLVRAHGMPPAKRAEWEGRGRTLADATCGHVTANQRLAAAAFARGLEVVMAGDPGHAEVEAVLGHAPGRGRVLRDIAEAEAFVPSDPLGKFLFLAQTTFDGELFARMAAVLERRFPACDARKTVCNATRIRQEEARELAAEADVLVVVGGRDSANTRRLADVGRELGKPVFAVETSDELRPEDFSGFAAAAVTAGASTPGWITQDVAYRLRFLGRRSVRDYLFYILYFLVSSRLLYAVSAFGLSLVFRTVTLRDPEFALAAAAGCYVFFAHILNRRVPDNPLTRELSGLDPFYRRHRTALLSAAWLAALVSLAVAWTEGYGTFLLYALAALSALCYSRLARSIAAIRSLRSFPGARELALSLGWTLVTVAPLEKEANFYPGALILCLPAFLLIFGKTLARDLRDMDGDHLLGLNTLPSYLGKAGSELLVLAAFAVGGVAQLLFMAGYGVAAASLVSAGKIVYSHPPAFAYLWLPFLIAWLLGLLVLVLMRFRAIRDELVCQAALEATGCVCAVCGVIGYLNAVGAL